MTTIWFAANHGDLGGGEVMTLNLARAARELGYDARVVAPSSPSRVVDLARSEGFRTVAIHGNTAIRRAVNLAAWDLAERRGLLWANGLRTALATAGHGQRIVHLHQVPRSGKQRWAVPVGAAGALAVVVPSQFAADAIPGAVVLPNWTQPMTAPMPARRLVSSRLDGPVVLGYLGRLSTHKGVDVLAQALALLDARHPGGFRLVLAGEPTYADAADRGAVDDALAPVQHLVDRVGWQTPGQFFASVDLAVFPSVIPETFGLVVAEAMSARCPYVISDAGALPEVAGQHPYVARAGDPEHLAATLDAAATGYDPGRLRGAYSRWAERYSPAAGRARLGTLVQGWGVEP